MPAESEDDYESSGSSGSESDRPNRWDGPPATWQDMNREEISTLTALDELKNRDLSVHLYNTYALKQRHKQPDNETGPEPEKDIDAATGETIPQDNWLPQRSWTAWPVSVDKVPPDDFMRCNENDPDDVYTIANSRHSNPSAPLEDAVAAAVLRFAKARFLARPWESAPTGPETEDEDGIFNDDDDDDGNDDDGDEGESSDQESLAGPGSRTSKFSRSRSRSRSKSIKRAASSSTQDKRHDPVDSGDEPDVDRDIVHPLGKRPLKPTVAEDDDLSYKIMRPAVRSVLTKLDATLTILHHSRKAAVDYMSDSSSDTEPEVSDRTKRSRSRGSEPPAKKRRGRPPRASLALRMRSPPPVLPTSNNEGAIEEPVPKAITESGVDTEDQSKKRKVGRPRKVYPRLEGETDRDFAIRVARLRKEPIPLFNDAHTLDSDNPKSSGSEASPLKPSKRGRRTSKPREPSPGTIEKKAAQRRRKALRYGIRDWKDVLGAAALAGFPRDALDRAARRCADLFQDSMELHSLNETLLDKDDQDQRVQYRPGMLADLADLDDEGEDDYSSGGETQSQTARHIRATSTAVSASSDGRGRSRSRSRSLSRARTTSRSRSTSVAGTHFCNVRGCPRSAEGFSRRQNLLRHMKLVHGIEKDEALTDIDVDSEDEVHGAVHVDGFLKPIRIRPAWKNEDRAAARKASGIRRGNKRDRLGSATETGADDSDVVMGDD
ncbi:hypothetical protein PFICI_06201 [Pestalotiopsis fici W106-1]|uniref:C2H2-type domain-containing protein n=1 Tax=Pestalotiopsis fici (strain W106-1 / CGMCC3.15140) TaxID=1229662 RepID=W3X5A6_PESFW|nr:uncharacterized protein PFICI_06201 [Pestalotiopsis fici W106-1]ETS81199.1 hypothetical protein PFICI_06201 [Pestalotiopsis fici W106-1]